MGQRLLSKEVDERFTLKVDKSIKREGVSGLMTWGVNNDYPQLMEKLRLGSPTAKAVSRVYSKFLAGHGFEAPGLNEIVIGKDAKGKNITLKSLLTAVCNEVAGHNGYYLHCNINLEGVIGSVHLKPFKNCRFSKHDDNEYSAQVLYYENWQKDSTSGKKYDAKKAKAYNVFNLNPDVIASQISKAGGPEKYKGQIYFQFLDEQYFYPLNPFDAVYLDCDTEAQISLYKNRQIRDGFFDQILIRVAPEGTEEEKQEFIDELKKKLGPGGDKVTVMEDDINPDTGEVRESGAFKVDKLETTVNDKLFENWEKSLSNNIRKEGGKGMPAILIDYEDNKLATTSGEAVIQATNFYNAITADDRAVIEQSFAEIFSKFDNEVLRKNTNWKIKPLNLIPDVLNISPATGT